jgi:DDE family transposase
MQMAVPQTNWAGNVTFGAARTLRPGSVAQLRRLIAESSGVDASHELVKHLLSLFSPRRKMLFTCGWMITAADEDAIKTVSADAWKPGISQDGTLEEDKHVAEITHLMSRAGNWPEGLRWIVRRVKPSRRQMPNLTDYEKKTGWKYSITCTNIPDSGIVGVSGSHHPQYIDVLHRDHATVETAGVRTAKAMELRNLPSKTWQVNAGWVIAVNIAADLAAWTRLLGHCDDPELRDADPDTLRYRVWHLPARLARHARQRVLAISVSWPWKEAFLTCWQRLCALPAPA